MKIMVGENQKKRGKRGENWLKIDKRRGRWGEAKRGIREDERMKEWRERGDRRGKERNIRQQKRRKEWREKEGRRRRDKGWGEKWEEGEKNKRGWGQKRMEGRGRKDTIERVRGRIGDYWGEKGRILLCIAARGRPEGNWLLHGCRAYLSRGKMMSGKSVLINE